MTVQGTRDTSEEADLLMKAGTGDTEAFRRLYSLMARPLFSMSVRILGNESDAEDAVQESFVKIWTHAGAYDPRRSLPFTWAATIVRRTSIDSLRRRGARAAAPGADDPGLEVAVDETVRASAEGHEAEEQARRRLRLAPDGPRRALELALFSGLTHSEISGKLKVPPGTVKTWIRRGLADLKEALHE